MKKNIPTTGVVWKSFRPQSLSLRTMTNLNKIPIILGIREDLQHLLTLRISKRAKRLIFKADTLRGVEIVIPYNFPQRFLNESLLQRRLTINRQLEEISAQRKELNPSSVELRAINESWQVLYSYGCEKPFNRINVSAGSIELYLEGKQILEPSHMLQKWLKARAKETLSVELDRISGELGATYNKLYVKNQKTVWGSCSRKKNLNLNQKLLFLSPETMSYVLFHELIHLKVFDHSSNFWKELGKVYKDPKEAQKALREESASHIPLWASI